MPAHEMLSSLQFTFRPGEPGGRVHKVTAQLPDAPDKADPVGQIWWHAGHGRVETVQVEKEHRRKGVATALWQQAHAVASRGDAVAPKHSDVVWPDGKAWIAGMQKNSKKPAPRSSKGPGDGQASLF